LIVDQLGHAPLFVALEGAGEGTAL
jgi:hypothetical protein